MTNETNWDKLIEDHEVAYLRADICIGSPESFTLEKKRKICEDLDASTVEMDAAMRADFERLPDFAKKRLMDMLAAPGSPERDFWESILLGFDSIPDAPPVTA